MGMQPCTISDGVGYARGPEAQDINILLVDDNESNLLALETILEGEHRNLVRASSGTEALHFLLSNTAAVVLLDIQMPGLDGLQTAELIRGRKRSRNVPIIFLTAFVSPDNVNLLKGYSLGAVDYITKPIDPVALKSKVAVFVELFRMNQQVTVQAEALRRKNLDLEKANIRRLGMLVEIGQRLSSEREPEQLLQLFCDSARDLLEVESAAAWISEMESESRQYWSTSGLGASLLDLVSAAARGVPAHRVSEQGIIARSQHRQLLTAPITAANQFEGMLYVADKLDGLPFTEADRRLLMTLTGQAMVAYENARLYSNLRRHAADLEREIAERIRLEADRQRLLESERLARCEAEQAYGLVGHLLEHEQEARAEAEAANTFKDQFLATVSHELRTPLNTILGWARMLHEKMLDSQQADHAAVVIVRSALAQARLIDDLLDTSRIIAGKISLNLIPVELHLIVTSVVDSLRPLAISKGVALEFSLGDETITVLGDVDRLQQVVSNLVSNGIKFTPAGGKVWVALQSTSGSAELIVADTGQGISETFLPHVFERFRQEDSSRTRVHGGLGLGLSIVHQLTQLHGGRITVSSQGPGQGTSFRLSLPLASAQIGPQAERLLLEPRLLAAQAPQTFDPVPDLTGLRILVVDDDADGCDLLRVLLESHHARVKCANSASQGLDTFIEWKPQLLLSDIGMPGGDGFSLLEKIRALQPDYDEVVAIAVTAFASTEDRLRSLSAGFRYHLAKPLDRNELMTLLDRLIASGEIKSI